MSLLPTRFLSALAGVALLVGAGVGAAGAVDPSSAQPTGPATGSASSTASFTGAAARTTPVGDNPLAGRTWGVYQGEADQAWLPYMQATGRKKELLAKIALQPKAQWFGRWISNAQIGEKTRKYIDNATAGDPETLVQMTVFRMDPWEGDACKRLPTKAQQKGYKQYVDTMAHEIAATHVALILQPDGPFALCAPHGSKLPSHLIRYAAKTFSALPNTSVYIDAGAADWWGRTADALAILKPAGVKYVRGFALNSTHYDSTAAEVSYGTEIVHALEKAGIPGKRFVVDTAQNGRPFEFFHGPGKNRENQTTCRSKSDTKCVTLGIPPTTDVANPAWGLSAKNNARAAAYVDAYLWFGRPWLYNQADPFVMQRALAVARTTPY